MKLIVAVTGASGMLYAVNFLTAVKKIGFEIHLIITDSAKSVAKFEIGSVDQLVEHSDFQYNPENMSACIASGSFKVDGMIIIPASMKTISALANGFSDNLVTRAADVQLKEKRFLILVPRETPLHSIHLENMTRLSKIGAIILPAMPGFYHNPEKIEDLANFISGKILDQLGIDNELFNRWGST
jgi:4-hydroxy-3-polyprenylbenzoate decarboxylase